MTQVALLTSEQRDIIEGMQYKPGVYFNPVRDADGNWIISMEEVNACNVPAFAWVKSLPLIDYLPKPIDLPYL